MSCMSFKWCFNDIKTWVQQHNQTSSLKFTVNIFYQKEIIFEVYLLNGKTKELIMDQQSYSKIIFGHIPSKQDITPPIIVVN